MRTIVAGNWKMHKTAREATALVDALLDAALTFPRDVEVVIAPPFTALAACARALRGQDRIALGAQTMHWEDQGAFTGEISAPMLVEFGVRFVILGHSERRALCGETDRAVNLKTKAALAHGLTPIVAVGETLLEKNAGQTAARVTAQTSAALADLSEEQMRNVVLAYEPVWAIGTGHSDDPGNADATMARIRACFPALSAVPILYGGSVKAHNMPDYAREPNINGALVGGASLECKSFSDIVAGALP